MKQWSDSIHEILKEIAQNQKFYLLHPARNKEILQAGKVDWDGYDLALFKDSIPNIDSDKDLELDLEKAAGYFLDLYRLGKFGQMTLDDCSKQGLKKFVENGGVTVDTDEESFET